MSRISSEDTDPHTYIYFLFCRDITLEYYWVRKQNSYIFIEFLDIDLVKKLKIMQVISDLHLEQRKKGQSKCIAEKIIVDGNRGQAKYLLIAGDIAPAFYPSLHPFLNILTSQGSWERIFYLPGNHEYYSHRGMQQVEEELNTFNMDKLTILQRSRLDLLEITLVGCTLWSELDENKFPEILSGYPDFSNIHVENKYLQWSQYQELHHQDVMWLEDEIKKESEKPLWVATHHLPSYSCLHPKYKEAPLNSCFANHLDYLKPVVWIFGHSHYPLDLTLNKTRYVSNPYGYSHEKMEITSKILPLPEVIC